MEAWRGFKEGNWMKEINISEFIQLNYTEYTGDDSFLEGPTEATTELWNKLKPKLAIEREKGIYNAETKIPSQIDAYGPGYIDKDLEKIVGVQTDEPLKRAIFPNGGLRMVENSLEAFGYKLDPATKDIYSKYRKTHNDGVFSAYTDEIRKARKTGVVTGLPDAYGRGRIIGDYRRVALYGVDFLIEERTKDWNNLTPAEMTEDVIRLREEIFEQVKSLKALKRMAESYGYDISKPASTAQEAIQWTYFAYLAATKDQNGAAMSIGRTSTFLDIFIERDLREGRITEKEAQEMIDHFVMKLRIIRFLRTPEYDALFSGDPVWVTESIGGMTIDGSRSFVTKNSFRILNTLYNLGPAPEPNLTVLWAQDLPLNWKKFCARVSIDTSSLQYENDDLMKPTFGDDYGIACCVSPMTIGRQMQFFGARVNLPKALLYAINGGKDEKQKLQVTPEGMFEPIKGDYLVFDEVWEKYDKVLDWLAQTYVQALNIIHYMHDKYSYESFEMALHDKNIKRTQAFGIAGLSIVADSLAAIKNGKVRIIRDEEGDAVDYVNEGADYVPFGNNDDSTDDFAVNITKIFMNKIRKHKMYRDAIPTQSVLTITSNVVYGKKTGNTPDGRRSGAPFGPGANPMHGRDVNGAVASLASVAKIPFEHANDGISYTFAITPETLGKEDDEKRTNLVGLLDGYFAQTGQHLNVNVFGRDLLEDAMEHPEKYPQLTIRVSGYAVNFVKLTKEQQLDVINRTISTKI
ncbi:formate C-acetyltransferase [Streptobacillus moniliformis]|uniref:Formate acetyltransferase n=1 Tax=Streptobacillus moniliformis (strain ATCC 14647 / DSM 12112 / NCTC 10651 / 9901) TaxID=519441 RepID=D1AUW1_STRM9|nr:formate C-acetyltransferase [Streptobacillus moniliformis]ACZ01521.1 formate acetyltransferase [Streptobacillus moniliformis DSM 12112]AVL43479.1 formate C-acetyltransferase [Streptobacillus moniliformis]SQA13315.1 Formate acetyltransferase 1 [Streptobacillus moniliformis]